MRTQRNITHLCRAALVLLAFVPVACGRAQGDENGEESPPALSAEEIRLARQVAENRLHLPTKPASPLERVYFIKVDLLPAADADDPERRVNVIHYRYDHDETIVTTVNLQRLEILKIEKYRHFPTGLAPEELARAEQLARADARLRALFASAIKVEGRPVQAATAADPLFGHRLVELALREGGDYVRAPHILVDLTSEIVHVDENLSR